MRNDSLVRVLKLVKYLDGKHCVPPTEQLAQEFQVSHRTIYRDLAALEDAQHPLPRRSEGNRI